MKTKLLIAAALAVLANTSNATIYTIEPDNYANGTVLDHIVPAVNLITALSDNQPVNIFHATASLASFGYASTGTNVFGAAGVPFFNSDRRLRMDFTAPVSAISIDFIGGEFFNTEVGRLDAYNSAGLLLDSYTTSPRIGGSVETMSVSRPLGDIAWAVAYVPPNQGDFGRLDNLQFTVVPEPSSAAILAGSLICFRATRRLRIQKA